MKGARGAEKVGRIWTTLGAFMKFPDFYLPVRRFLYKIGDIRRAPRVTRVDQRSIGDYTPYISTLHCIFYLSILVWAHPTPLCSLPIGGHNGQHRHPEIYQFLQGVDRRGENTRYLPVNKLQIWCKRLLRNKSGKPGAK